MNKLTIKITEIIFFSLITVLTLVSCKTEIQQNDVSLKGEKITDTYMQKFKGASGDCCKGKTNIKEAYQIYKVNTKSSQADVVMQKIKSALEASKSKVANKNNNIDPTLIGEPKLQESIIIEENGTGQNIILTPIDDGVNTIEKVAYTKYNESTNETEDAVLYTAKTNFTKTELDANPDLWQESTITLQLASQTGQVLYNQTIGHSDQNMYKNISKFSSLKSKGGIDLITCFTDCVEEQFAAIDSWYEQLFCSIAGHACAIGIAQGCWSGCTWAWMFEVL